MNLKESFNELKNRKMDSKALGMLGNAMKQNGSTIAMLGGILGLGIALYAAFRASDEISEIREKYDSEIGKVPEIAPDGPKKIKELKTTRNIKYVLAYRWVLLFGGMSTGCMILSNCLSGATIAGLTTALAFEKDKVKSLITNGKEMFGEEKFKELEDKTLEDLISRNFFGDDGPQARRLSPRDGTLVIDTDTATIFQISRKDLDDVLFYAKEYCSRCHGLSQEKFFEMLGFVEAPTRANAKFWGPNCPFEAHVGNRSYLGAQFPSIEYKHLPTTAYKAGIPGAKNPN